MMEDNLKEMTAAGTGGIAAIGINRKGSSYNAGGDPADTYGEPPGVLAKFGRNTNVLKRNVSLLNRPSLLPNSKKAKPLRNILDPNTPIGRV
jgi:hypothetical protein